MPIKRLEKELAPSSGGMPVTLAFAGTTGQAWEFPLQGFENHTNFRVISIIIEGTLNTQFVTQGVRAYVEHTRNLDFSVSDDNLGVPVHVTIQKGDGVQASTTRDVMNPLIIATADVAQTKFNVVISLPLEQRLLNKARLNILFDTGVTAGSFTVEKVTFVGYTET